MSVNEWIAPRWDPFWGEANLAYAYENIRIKPGDEGIFTVEVHRPEVLNALNDATICELDECFRKLATDSDGQRLIAEFLDLEALEIPCKTDVFTTNWI